MTASAGSPVLNRPLRSLDEVLAARAVRDQRSSQNESGSEKAKPPLIEPPHTPEGRGE